MNFQKFFLIITIVSTFLSCKKENDKINIQPEDYHNLVDKLTEVMIHDIYSPPVASRIYAYPNIAAYETLNQSSNDYKSLVGQLNGLDSFSTLESDENINLRLAALIAYLDVAKELVFTKERITIFRDSLYNKWEELNSDDFLLAKDYALKISNKVLKWMDQDNYKETRTMPDYNIYEKDPSRWEPTPPAYMKGIEPNWNKIRPFVLDSASQFKPLPPHVFSLTPNTKFHDELMEVFNIVSEIRIKGDSSNEMAIARFWDCNPYVSVNKGHFMFAEKKITPGAHWIGICKIASIKTNANFEKTVFAYTKTSIAITDAFISCWDEKYRSNLVRPETLINKYIDEKWSPILQTPPFPEYPSGHSVVSGAASEVLTSIFGDNLFFEDTTEVPYGLPVRNFESFRIAAQEAAMSRLYGGIHYMSAIKLGLKQGINIGNLVNSKVVFSSN